MTSLHRLPASKITPQIGFTLVELLITLAISAILLSIAVPSFASIFQNTKLESAAHQLIVELNSAQALAMTRQQKVVMCRSNDGESCIAHDTDSNQNWSVGWITFIESDISSPIERDNSETLYRVVDGAQYSNLSIKHSTRLRSFTAQGTTSAGNYQFCDDSGGDIQALKVIIIGTGRTRLETVSGLNVCPA